MFKLDWEDSHFHCYDRYCHHEFDVPTEWDSYEEWEKYREELRCPECGSKDVHPEWEYRDDCDVYEEYYGPNASPNGMYQDDEGGWNY